MSNKTLLNAVNDMFKMANIIAGDADSLTSLTDSARQGDIDYCVIALNQVIDELYTSDRDPSPSQQATSTITLATGTRSYSLVANYVRLHWPLIDKTHSQYIWQEEQGYDYLLSLDPEGDDDGLPYLGVVSPIDGTLYVYPTPTSADNGKIYTYQYDKNLGLSSASDTVPFNDTVYRAVVPAAFQIWKRERRNQFDEALFKTHLGRAARLLSGVPPSDHYSPRG